MVAGSGTLKAVHTKAACHHVANVAAVVCLYEALAGGGFTCLYARAHASRHSHACQHVYSTVHDFHSAFPHPWPSLLCRYDISGLRSDSNGKASILDRLFAPQRVSLHPYGVDPVFLPSSHLYDAQLGAQGGSAQLYYNTSIGAGEVSPTGTPYGFFPMPGLEVCTVR